MRRTEQNEKIGTVAFGEAFVGPGVRRPAAVKIDVRRDDRPGRRQGFSALRAAGAVRRAKKAVDLIF